MKTIKTILHYYHFDISNGDQKKAYNELCARLTGEGLKCFDSISPGHFDYYSKQIKPLHNSEISLETQFLFENQWNTAPVKGEKNGLHVFDWAEAIYPNKRIKEGHYLTQTDEMRTVRADSFHCGYCGAKYHLPTEKYCTKCLGNEYLKESDLPLLFLRSYSDKSNTLPDVPIELLSAYQSRQQSERTLRATRERDEAIKRLEMEKASNEREYQGRLMIIKAGLDFDNVIYYSHTSKFCFGWRSPLSGMDVAKIKNQLKAINFPYQTEFKTA